MSRRVELSLERPDLPIRSVYPQGEQAMSKISLDGVEPADVSLVADLSPSERRRATRSSLTVRIDYATVDEIFSEFTRDINEGGLFIETEKPHLPGTDVSMQFHLPGSDEVVETLGRVVRVSGGGTGTPPGMGIEFDELKPDDRRKIDRIVRALRASSGR
jgi:uncharacterized protein (TIGR02266 family)